MWPAFLNLFANYFAASRAFDSANLPQVHQLRLDTKTGDLFSCLLGCLRLAWGTSVLEIELTNWLN